MSPPSALLCCRTTPSDPASAIGDEKASGSAAQRLRRLHRLRLSGSDARSGSGGGAAAAGGERKS
eukprot:5362303-Prymnesium_polylepis.1